MADEQTTRTGRRSADADLAALAEWRQGVNDKLEDIHAQCVKTNGRLTELEVKERIRQDREDQRAMRLAASEAAKWRVEQQSAEQRTGRLSRLQLIGLWAVGALGATSTIIGALIAARVI